MKAKYPNGTRVKVKYGHLIWNIGGGKEMKATDISPHLTEDIATVEYTYGEKSETDFRYSQGDDGYKRYSLRFDKFGGISWFDEDCLIPQST